MHTLAVAASFGLENIIINLIKKMTTSLVVFFKSRAYSWHSLAENLYA